MAKELQAEYLFESSWEVCNMVGGIYTMLSTKAATLQQQYGDYDESSTFGYASGMILESYYKFFGLSSKQSVIAHFDE